ncbi:MAG TPA: DegT/DnrJ/EryC1/StrS family aminotransferase [Polyangiaceae bacterium]|nr:DegT/DnrJ/EryC1/StrS family aminotransferase [Polyangiaceae bacterium]
MNRKDSVKELAIFSGAPAFPETLHVGCPNLGDRARFLARVEGILDRRWFTNNGPMVLELEQRLASLLDVRNCVLTCNATIALQMAIRALGLKGEVILPSFTFIATAHALAWQEVTPVFCDVDARTHNIDPKEIEQLITPRTTGIIGVHVWGRPCDVDSIDRIAKKHSLKVLYDAAHAFACSRGGRKIGGFGDAEVFSFHATKFFNTFEGGAITTNNDALAERLRLVRNFGFVGADKVQELGINGKLPEVSAAMGLTLLESLDSLVDTNRRNYDAYSRELASIPGLSLLQFDPADQNNLQYIVVSVDPGEYGLDRDRTVEILHRENVLARRYFNPGCHRMEPYSSTGAGPRRPLPVTERLASSLMTLPNGTAVGPAEIETICHLLRLARETGQARG